MYDVYCFMFIFSREMGNLEKFRESQKHMEEANKQRKALLAKTLNERLVKIT